jgi:hypothetical protein
MNRETPRYSKPDLEFSPILNRMQSFNNEQKSHNISRLSESNNENPRQKYSPFVIKHSPNLLFSPPCDPLQNENYFQNSSNSGKTNYKIYTPSPNHLIKERLSDRFIPMNRGTNLLEKFEMTKNEQHEGVSDSNSKKDSNNHNIHMNDTYSNLLENNFFQRKLDFFTSDSETSFAKNNKDSQIKSNIFSFRSEGKRRWSHGVNASSLGVKDNSVKEETRKINTRPYKILEAPGLLDDFYLNLVDWSSRNDIAVGQRESVYVWCANKTQCVKLLSYEEKYVSSVIWNSSGDKVAVGNSEGSVEVWDGKIFIY